MIAIYMGSSRSYIQAVLFNSSPSSSPSAESCKEFGFLVNVYTTKYKKINLLEPEFYQNHDLFLRKQKDVMLNTYLLLTFLEWVYAVVCV